ncbi:MAG: DUF4870 domain-containing protein [Bacteroidia bacterium]
MSKDYLEVPQPEEITIREREDAMGGYLMMFASFAVGLPLPIINLIAAVIYYFTNRGKSRFVDFHVTQSLFSQLPTTLMNAVLVGWTIRTFYYEIAFTDMYKGYLVMVVLANIIYLIFSIIAAVRARRGQFYYFIFFGPWAYHLCFKNKAVAQGEMVNKPPRL